MTQTAEKENIMGTMPEGRLLLKLAMPMIFSVLVSSLYNIVDSIFVGRIGQNALTAISLGAPASSLMVELSFGVAVGVNAMLSRKLGEKDREGVSKAAGQGFLLIGAVYLICLAFGLFGVRAFYSIQTNDAEIISLGMQYTQIVTICSFGLMIQTIVERLLSSTGRTNGSMAVLLTGAITNIILDPILIFGYLGLPAMGMTGAAIATVIGQCAAEATGLVLNLRWNKEIEFRVKSFLPDFKMMKEIMVIAIPTTLTYSINSILIFGMNQVLVGLSLAAPAVYVIYNRVRSFVALPVWGIRNTIIYYETLDFLLAEMQTELSTGFIDKIKDYELPVELDKVNRVFFEYSAEQGLAYEKITCSGTYHSIRDEMIENVNNAGWGRSEKFQNLSAFEKKLLMDFVNNAVLTAYRHWVEEGKATPLEEVIEVTNRLVLGGVNGFFQAKV